MCIFYRSVKLFILVTALFVVCADFAWSEFRVYYRYKNRFYKEIRPQLCNQEEYAIELARSMDKSLDQGMKFDEFSRLYKTNLLDKNYPNCFFEEESKVISLDIIPTETKHWGIIRTVYYANDGERYILYQLYMKNFNDVRLYDSPEQLIGLIESGEIDWDWLSDIGKQAIWSSFNDAERDKNEKKLQDVLDARAAASLYNLVNESLAMLKPKDSSPSGDAVLRERTPLVEVGGYSGEQRNNSLGGQ